jgi:hypothetical protein
LFELLKYNFVEKKNPKLKCVCNLNSSYLGDRDRRIAVGNQPWLKLVRLYLKNELGMWHIPIMWR